MTIEEDIIVLKEKLKELEIIEAFLLNSKYSPEHSIFYATNSLSAAISYIEEFIEELHQTMPIKYIPKYRFNNTVISTYLRNVYLNRKNPDSIIAGFLFMEWDSLW